VNHDASHYIALASDGGGTTPNGTPGIYHSSNGIGWTRITGFEVGLDDSQTWKWVACNNNNNVSTFVACSSGAGGTSAGVVWYNDFDPSLGVKWQEISTGAHEYFSVAIDSYGTKIAACAQNNGLFYGNTSSLAKDTAAPASGGTPEVVSVHLRRSSVTNAGLPQYLGVLGAASSTLYLASYSSPICFKEGTHILCLVDGKNLYVPVESLRKGHLVKTHIHGYKKVELIGHSKVYNSGNGKKSLSSLVKCTPAKYPELTDDLVITGSHSILVGELTPNKEHDLKELVGKIYITDDKYRLVSCLDDRSEPYEEEGVFNIWHFALENEQYTWNYGVYANGLLVETASLRMMKEFSGMTLV
jgi:hypothetical protein